MVPSDRDDLVDWRLDTLERTAAELTKAVSDLRDFLVSIRAWVKMVAIVWTAAQGVIVILIANILLQRGG